MRIQKLIRGAASALAVLGVVVLAGGSTVSALPATESAAQSAAKRGLQRIQFAATGFPTFYEDTITDPPGTPQVGQGFTLKESIVNTSGTVIGTSHVQCTIIGVTPTPSLIFTCHGTFTFTNGGTLNVVVPAFNFNPASLPATYDSYIIGGTGTYAGAFGVIHVTDPGPGNPTGYVFDFYDF